MPPDFTQIYSEFLELENLPLLLFFFKFKQRSGHKIYDNSCCPLDATVYNGVKTHCHTHLIPHSTIQDHVEIQSEMCKCQLYIFTHFLYYSADDNILYICSSPLTSWNQCVLV